MAEQEVQGSAQTRRSKSKYGSGYGYCSRCRKFFPLEIFGIPHVGIPRCPMCSTLLRTKPRHSRHKRKDAGPEKLISS
jgi:DNA-directed RNA polymerase subunit RPC12/RpoP